MRLRIARVLSVVVVAVAAARSGLAAERPTIAGAGYAAEFERLLDHVAASYANLEWIAANRPIDAKGLAASARAALLKAGSRGEARRAIAGFVEGFGDPHFRVQELEGGGGQAGKPGGGGPGPADSPASACEALGYRSRDLGFRLPWPKEKGWQSLPAGGNPFEAGLLTAASGTRLGVLRIAHFGEDGYPSVCEEVWREERKSLPGPCDRDCRSAFRGKVTRRLLGRLEERIAALAAASPDRLVVDLTGNGGGTDWMHQAARMLSARPLSCQRASFVRHPHWVAPLAEMKAELSRDLARGGWSGADRRYLEQAATRAASLLAEAESPCDRRGWFDPSKATPGCSGIAGSPYTTCGLLDYLPPGALDGAESRESAFKPLRHPYREGIWRGPLVVLIDGGTASASEGFVSLLSGNGAATLVGARTHGSGCGYTNGGLPFEMSEAGLRVWMPDCLRFRADGVNELAGFLPDVDAGWERGDGNPSRLKKALKAIDGLPR